MAWRPGEWVLEGLLDNTTPGWTTGWIRLEGCEDPLTKEAPSTNAEDWGQFWQTS